MTIQNEVLIDNTTDMNDNTSAEYMECDILIIGAGFSGCYLLHKLRNLGYNTKIYEAGKGIGGTWYWNKYPGARVDSDIPIYELSIDEVWKGWYWNERFPGWKELQNYFNYLDTKINISKDTFFDTKVVDASFNLQSGKWIIKTEDGKTCICKYLLPCVGFAAKRYIPDWKGLDKFKGILCHSSFWPKDDYDVTNKRCAVIGTGSTGVQITQEWGKKAKSLIVFQRTPNLAIPMMQCKISKEEQNKNNNEHFKTRNNGFGGFPYNFINRNIVDESPEEREKTLEILWNNGGFKFWIGSYQDYLFDEKANRIVYDFWAKKQRKRIIDPRKRDILVPVEPPHPFGTKRPSLEQDYYEMFNKDTVDVVSVNNNPIKEFTETGIILEDDSFYEFDIVAIATGFDAVTGSLINTGIKDIDGNALKDLWKDGAKTYCGISIHNFPNMFYTYGPQAPTAFANGPTLIEMQSEFITNVIKKMEKEKIKYINPTVKAQEEYVKKVHQLSNMSLFPLADSWYMGANIPGKKREMLNYLGGIPQYGQEIKQLINNDYFGFEFVYK